MPNGSPVDIVLLIILMTSLVAIHQIWSSVCDSEEDELKIGIQSVEENRFNIAIFKCAVQTKIVFDFESQFSLRFF